MSDQPAEMHVMTAGAAAAAAPGENTELNAMLKRFRDYAASKASEAEKKKQCVSALVTAAGSEASKLQGINAGAIQSVAEKGMLASASELNQAGSVKICGPDGTYKETHECKMEKQANFESGKYSITLGGLPSDLFLETVDSSGNRNPSAENRAFARFSAQEDKVSFKILPDLSEKANTALKIFSLSKMKFTSEAAADHENMNSILTERGSIAFVHLFVCVVPSKECDLPQGKVLVLGKNTTVSNSFMVVIPDGLNEEAMRGRMMKYVNSLPMRKIVNDIFQPDAADKAGTTLKLKGIPVRSGYVAVGKELMAQHSDDDSPSKEPWPQICCIAAFETCGEIEYVKNIPSNLATSLGNTNLRKAYKITNLCVRLKNCEKTTARDYSIYIPHEALKANFIKSPDWKNFFRNASICLDDSKDNFERLDQYLTQSLTIDNTNLRHTIQNSWSSCVHFFDTDKVDCEYKLKVDIATQLQEKAKEGKAIGHRAALLAIAASLHSSLKGPHYVAGLSLPPFECSMDFPVPLVMAFPQRITALIREKLSVSADGDACYPPASVQFLDWLIFASNIKFIEGKQPNLFQMIFYLLCASILMCKEMNVDNVLTKMSLECCENMPIFHEESMSKDLKLKAVKHFFLCLFGNLFWTVDVLYGMPNKLSTSWLAIRINNNRRVPHTDVCKNANLKPRLITTMTEIYYDYSKSMNPLMIVKILAYIREYGEVKTPDEMGAAKARLDSMDVNKAKESAYALIDNIYNFKKTKMPLVNAGFGKEVSTIVKFDEDKDKFDIPNVDQAFEGELPKDFHFSGEPFVRPDVQGAGGEGGGT